MEKKSKSQLVLEHLQRKGSITSWEAIENYGATRLSAIIFNLKKKYNITTEDVHITDRFGNKTTIAKYVYVGEI